ncbi:hypothetical protein LTR84_011129 [Exophiala bonariae]|uniref:Uncharacterized protein n=1 Tax=Exophiala bonariae TaxID=1690606 RepID=A0AAV9NIB9_9EURO|nr:hypothetical protein LTR84_011129 [Exophiala bonariae]
MKGYNPPDDLFLEPAHSHDPTDVSHVAALPDSMLSQLPPSVQDALWTLQESTSVVYASYERLQELLDQRFDRLVYLPIGDGTAVRSYSEGAFFNYVNHLAAERRYLLEDALPDWKHKASRAGLRQYNDLMLTFRGKEMKVIEWFSQLQAAVSFWCYEARQTELPDFDSTILEYESQSSTPSSEASESDLRYSTDQRPVSTGREPVATAGFGLEVSKALEAL